MKQLFLILIIICGLSACKTTASTSSSAIESREVSTTSTDDSSEKSSVNPKLQVSPGNKTMVAPKKNNAAK